jgi:beta-aspartyl-peptidase (threonine type)
VHGGAGDVPPEALARHVEGCRRAALEGAKVLRAGGSALDAAQRAVEVLEDDPCFNAGTGACLNEEGTVELDASVMEGTHLRGAGVCALPAFKNPIRIARAALEDGRHVLYAADGAARFAQSQGFDPVAPETMITASARRRWEAVKSGAASAGWAGGTVGAVARDATGAVAAATSTGGRVNKAKGRVGDSPVLGAGTYADDDAGACSNTGDGEAVLRLCLAKSAIEWMRMGAFPEDAARAAVRHMIARTGGTGGIILVDRAGRLGWARTTRTMTWGAVRSDAPDGEAGG